MLHCFSAIHSSCLKVPVSTGEEDALLFSVFLFVHLCLCETVSEEESKKPRAE